MSMIDDVLAQFKEHNVSDFQIDRLVAAAEKFAEDNSSDTKVQGLLAAVKSEAEAKKMNKDILMIDNIHDSEGLRTAVCDYAARVDKNPEATNRIKLYGLAERMCELGHAGLKIDAAADVMTRYLDRGANESNVRACAQLVMRAYELGTGSKRTPDEAQRMFRNLDKLSEFYPDAKYSIFLNNACCLEDKKTADVYLKYLSKYIGEHQLVYDSGKISDRCSEILSAHPEMARSCMDVVKKSLDYQSLNENNYRGKGEALKKAAEFYNCLDKLDGVSKEDKILARIGKKKVDKELEQRNKSFLEGKRVILSPDKPPRVVSEEDFGRMSKGKDGR